MRGSLSTTNTSHKNRQLDWKFGDDVKYMEKIKISQNIHINFKEKVNIVHSV